MATRKKAVKKVRKKRITSKPSSNGKVEDYRGEIKFKGKVFDAWILKLSCQGAEESHKLADNGYMPTVDFLTDIAGTFSKFVPGCTPSEAMELWNLTNEGIIELERVKKNTSA